MKLPEEMTNEELADLLTKGLPQSLVIQEAAKRLREAQELYGQIYSQKKLGYVND